MTSLMSTPLQPLLQGGPRFGQKGCSRRGFRFRLRLRLRLWTNRVSGDLAGFRLCCLLRFCFWMLLSPITLTDGGTRWWDFGPFLTCLPHQERTMGEWDLPDPEVRHAHPEANQVVLDSVGAWMLPISVDFLFLLLHVSSF